MGNPETDVVVEARALELVAVVAAKINEILIGSAGLVPDPANPGLYIPSVGTLTNLAIGDVAPTPATGHTVLWVDTTSGNISLNLVTGD